MRKCAAGVIGIFLILYILPLGWRSLAVPDETRYAEIPREMIASGDWVTPRLNGVRYFEKPVLGYWLNAASILVFGENAFAVRLPTALAAGMTALILFLLVRRFHGTSDAALLTAGAYLTTILVLALGTINILDTMLTLFLTGAMASFFLAHRETRPARQTALLALFGASCGLAFLVKGFLAFAVPVVVIVPFLAWERRLKDLVRIPWIPLLALLAVTLPWAVLVHLREGDFWNYFFWTEHISRFLSPMPGQHPKPFWYFIPILAGGALPWVVFLPAVVPETTAGLTRKDPLLRFAVCWFVFPFLFFSACSGKLIPYILPCLPPLLVIIAMGLTAYFEKGRRRAFNVLAVAVALLMGILSAGLILNQSTRILAMRAYTPSETWKWVTVAIGLLAWGTGALLAAMQSDWRRKLTLFTLAPLPLLLSVHAVLPNQVVADRTPETILLRHQDQIHPDTVIVTDNDLVHAVCWFYKRDDVHLLETPGELRYGLKRDDAQPPRLLTMADLTDRIAASPTTGKTVLFLKREDYQQMKDHLPEPVAKDMDDLFVFVKF
jgi:4-amino-4-deoxy-L-arabinose transferase